MNIVIVAEKHYRRLFEDCLRNENHNLLGYETEMKANFNKRIAEHYNPHILVVVRGCKSKNYDFFANVKVLLELCPTLRIIYFYGNVTKDNEQDYLDTVETLAPFEIYDIFPYDLYERGFKTKFLELLSSEPTSSFQLQKILEQRRKDEENAEQFIRKFERIIDTTPVDLSKQKVDNEVYDSENVETIDMIPERLSADENITIGTALLSDRQTGNILTAFEIAVILKEAKKSAAVFLDDETYQNYIFYHGIEDAPKGCKINGLTVYPMSLFDEKRLTVKYAVCDFGTAPAERSGDNYDRFVKAEIKICICSFNEWDICTLADWLNSPLPYIKEINYIFFPVSEKSFIKFSKQMAKGHCKTFRTESSPDYTQPCEWNKKVYSHIMKQYTDFEPAKKHFSFKGRQTK